jgi:putative glycosyltransferase
MRLSIVTTLYHSAPYTREFYERMVAAAAKVTGDFEIIFVNDGSPDNSLDLAVELHKNDSRVVVIDLSRNFGHHKAMMTGLSHAHGERVFLLDSDLEEEPEWLESFTSLMNQKGCDVVYGVQEQRKGDWFERCSGLFFYKLFKFFTGLNLPENLVTARLMTRRYVEALLRFEEREMFLAGLWHITGFDQQPRIVTKHATSKTTYDLRRKFSVLVNSITSFSNAPLIGIFYFGVAISLLAFVFNGLLVVQWFFFATPLSGWTSVMGSIWLLGGIVISFIGVIGIYLYKIFSETKRRPYTIIRQIYGQRGKA